MTQNNKCRILINYPDDKKTRRLVNIVTIPLKKDPNDFEYKITLSGLLKKVPAFHGNSILNLKKGTLNINKSLSPIKGCIEVSYHAKSGFLITKDTKNDKKLNEAKHIPLNRIDQPNHFLRIIFRGNQLLPMERTKKLRNGIDEVQKLKGFSVDNWTICDLCISPLQKNCKVISSGETSKSIEHYVDEKNGIRMHMVFSKIYDTNIKNTILFVPANNRLLLRTIKQQTP